ncbi:TetR/AcrR family transcriptional regulator [Cytobacillus sp. Hz8]|uniref:TetR/AcrR family transcriptional regulator n=1 Tax=Cytobacillus sp. Hz8 TaxID=3347168 RepID=UPI0035D6F3A7
MVYLEKFFGLPVEKQNTIIDAALTSFGKNGYKKASISEIAQAAGISKAMVFHYFGTKKTLYLFLIRFCGKTLMDEVNKNFDPNVTDFFDRIKMAGDIEFEVMKRHPAIISFLKSLYQERDEEVKSEIQSMMADKEAKDFQMKIAFDGIDTSKFKDNVDPKQVVKMLMWMSEGCFIHLENMEGAHFDLLYQEYIDCFNLLKNAFYK